MPWIARDARAHNHKADTAAKKKKWAAIANAVLEESGDEAKAIRIANARLLQSNNRGRKK